MMCKINLDVCRYRLPPIGGRGLIKNILHGTPRRGDTRVDRLFLHFSAAAAGTRTVGRRDYLTLYIIYTRNTTPSLLGILYALLRVVYAAYTRRSTIYIVCVL